jgi:stage II sporulation SpoE-like protein/GAF domain-containing protein
VSVEELIRTPVLPVAPGPTAALLDPARIGAVLDTQLLGTPAEDAFDDLVELARAVSGAELAAFAVVDANRSYRKAALGPGLVPGSAHPVHESSCAVVIDTDVPLVVTDTAADERVRSLGFVADTGAAALCCVPVRGPGGHAIGTLLVADRLVREWTPAQVRALHTTARVIGRQVLLRQSLRATRGQVNAMGDRLAAVTFRRDALTEQLSETRALAASLQDSLLPPALASIPGADAAAAYLPASAAVEVVGDFYDLFAAGKGSCVVMGDVCGKGVEAAKVTALARYTVRTEATQHAEPHIVLRRLHEALRTQNSGAFLTAVVVMLEADGHGGLVGALCSGGHEPVLVRRADGAVERIWSSGPMLGVFAEPDLRDIEVALGPGDLMLLYTDGITEARPGRGGELFGDDRLAAVVAACGGLTAEQAVEHVISAAVDHRRGGTSNDDTAVLAIRVPG